MSPLADLLFQHPAPNGDANLVFGDVDAPVVPVGDAQYDDGQLHGDLLFQRPSPNGNANLVFGDTGDAQPPVDIAQVTMTGHNKITGLRGKITGRVVAVMSGSSRVTGLRVGGAARVVAVMSGGNKLPGLAGHITSVYDVNVTRYLQGTATGQHNPARPVSISVTAWHGVSQSQRGGTDVWWQTAIAQAKAVDSQHSQAISRRLTTEATWQLAVSHQTDLQARHQAADKRVASVRTGYDLAQSWQRLLTSRMQTGIPLRNQLHTDWQPADHRQHLHTGRSGASLRRWGRQFEVARWQQAMHPPTGRSVRPSLPAKPPCYLPDPNLLFDAPWSASARLVFVCETHGPGPNPGPAAAVVVPILRTYVVINSISLRRVDTGAELHAHGFSMSLDYQSWTWTWNASLHHDAEAHLGRDTTGDPAELEVVVNGIPFRLRLERIVCDRRFDPTRWAVSGRGKASVLAKSTLSFGNTADRTAQQLMADALTVNGASLGWAVEWGLTDWLVPAGAWSMRGSYIDAINDIATAAGGYVQPHNTDATLRILPRYPVAPWNWGTVTPDFEIPDGVAEVEGTEYIDKPSYNKVFVGGVGAGVFGPFKHAGTAGDILAPQVTHALITHADAHRQRGLAELSDTGSQEHITLKMQVLPETGIIMPGQFVRYAGKKPAVGIVRSVGIDWAFPVLRQTIGIETHA